MMAIEVVHKRMTELVGIKIVQMKCLPMYTSITLKQK